MKRSSPPDGIQAEKEKMIINGRYNVLQKIHEETFKS